MHKLKALILGLLLLVPLFVFIFISTFGEHHFALRTYFPLKDAAGELVFDGAGDTVFARVPDFRLLSQQGDTISQSATLQDALYVAGFFSTRCPDECRKMSAQLVRVQEAFENDPSVKLLSFSLAPAQDSVAALYDFAARYNADPQKWFFLTGDSSRIYKLAAEGFHLPPQPKELLYGGKLLLVDKERQVRGIYEGTEPVEVDRLITEINVLLDEYNKGK